MTDTEQPTMEQEARESAARLEQLVERATRLRNLGRADDAAEELEDEIRERPYGISLSTTIEVELYGGGPAGGIHFEVYRDSPDDPWEYGSARVWHQDWFQPKGWANLDDDVATYLWEAWGLAFAS